MLLRRKRRFAEVVRSSVVLHLTSGQSVAGILLGAYDDSFALARTRLLAPSSGRVVPLDGEIVVPRESVLFAQVGVTIDDTRELELSVVRESRG